MSESWNRLVLESSSFPISTVSLFNEEMSIKSKKLVRKKLALSETVTLEEFLNYLSLSRRELADQLGIEQFRIKSWNNIVPGQILDIYGFVRETGKSLPDGIYCKCGCGAKLFDHSISGVPSEYIAGHEVLFDEYSEQGKKNIRNKPTKGELVRFCCLDGFQVEDLAKIFSRSERTINNWLQEHGIYRDSLVNKDFFIEWSPGSAWALGLLFTDGSMTTETKNRGSSIRLSQKDPEILYKTKELLGLRGEIRKRKNGPTRYCHHLEINYHYLINDLKALGLTSNKSLTMTFPTMPIPMERHFIRGCWDGDGGFTKPSASYRMAHFTSGSKEFIEEMAVILFRACFVRRRLTGALSPDKKLLLESTYGEGPYPLNIVKQNKSKAYRLTMTGSENLQKFFEYLYSGVDSSILYTLLSAHPAPRFYRF